MNKRTTGMVVVALACAQVPVWAQVTPVTPGAPQPGVPQQQQQQQFQQPPVQARPGFTPAPATTQPSFNGSSGATTRPVGRLVSTTQGGGVLMNFRDASIDSVLDQLSEAAGFIVVREAAISGRITMVSKQAVSREEAVSLLNTVLKPNGLAVVQTGRTLKVMAIDKAKTANLPVHTGANPDEIEETDDLITQVVPISSVDAVQLKNDLAPMTGEASVTANAASNSIIITDRSANIKRIVKIIASLDAHQSEQGKVKVFQLKNASASAAAKLINDVFGQSNAGGSSGGGTNGGSGNPFFSRFRGFGGGGFSGFGGRGGGGEAGGAPGGQPGAQGARSVIKITTSADDRTNRLVVAGPAATLDEIEKVIKEIDSDPAEQQGMFVYSLKNGQAANLQAVLNQLINGTGGSTGVSSSRTGGTSGSSRSAGFGSNRSGGGRSGSSSGGFGGGGFGGGGFGGGGFGGFGGFNSGFNRGGLSSAGQSAASDLAGQVTVVADADTNSLLIMTAPKNFERVKVILADLDRPVPQVLIKVLVAEVTHDNTTDLGAEFSVLNLRANGKGAIGGTDGTAGNIGAAGSPTNFQTFQPGFNGTTPPTSGGAGGLVARLNENNLSATFRALQTAGKLDVLSRPYILTSDNQAAEIIIGQSVPIPQNSRITDTGQIINSFTYEDVGIILDVTPHINPDGLVTLDVAPTVSSLSGETVPITQGLGSPVINQRSAASRVAIMDGQTIVIGGMMSDQKQQTVNKVPILGDIPGLGLLFQRNTTSTRKTELLFFLTPHVASNPNNLDPMSKDEMKGTKLTPNAVSPGTFQEHMEGMRRGAATRPATVEQKR